MKKGNLSLVSLKKLSNTYKFFNCMIFSCTSIKMKCSVKPNLSTGKKKGEHNSSRRGIKCDYLTNLKVFRVFCTLFEIDFHSLVYRCLLVYGVWWKSQACHLQLCGPESQFIFFIFNIKISDSVLPTAQNLVIKNEFKNSGGYIYWRSQDKW